MRADGREMTRLTDGFSRNYGPTFAKDGRIFFTSDRSGFENIWSVHPGSGMTGGDVARTTHNSTPNPYQRAGLVKDGL